jgi:glucosamine--fructose-6-phosphate aminotransferase (isomerizing)
METKQEIQGIPRALAATLQKGRPEFEALVRRTRWGEGPLYICGGGASGLISLTGVYAFESLLGWPVVARPAAVFQNYSLPVLRPRSVLLVISPSDEIPEALELARTARSRGANVLALTNHPQGPLAQIAEGVFLTRTGEAASPATTVVCQHAALNYIALVAARVLKRPNPQMEALQEEFEKLPQHVEWALTQLSEAVRALASELRGLRNAWLAGGGFYHPLALQGARRLNELAALHTQGSEASEFRRGPLQRLGREDGAVFLSGSRSRMKKEIHQAAAQARIQGVRILSLTDRNDRELADRSDLALLLPTLTEMVGSTLTLVLLEWLAVQAAREPKRDRDTSRREPSAQRVKDTGGAG